MNRAKGSREESAAECYIDASSREELASRGGIRDPKLLERLLLKGERVGPYTVLGFVAAGGMGEIYAARREGQKSGRPVALKILNPDLSSEWHLIERFKREAEISRKLRSKYVIRVYEYGTDARGRSFMSMELLRGEELFDRIHNGAGITQQELARIGVQSCKGLEAIHKAGIIHRDIKPENIFIARDRNGRERVKILDFGIAKFGDVPSDPTLSVQGQVYGTPQYISPEQCLSPDIDHRSDLYSLGVILYEGCCGYLPFDKDTDYATMNAQQHDEVPPLPGHVDPALAEIIYKALAKNPGDRFQSARMMGALLYEWLEIHGGEMNDAALTGDFPTSTSGQFESLLRESAELSALQRDLADGAGGGRHATPASLSDSVIPMPPPEFATNESALGIDPELNTDEHDASEARGLPRRHRASADVAASERSSSTLPEQGRWDGPEVFEVEGEEEEVSTAARVVTALAIMAILAGVVIATLAMV